MRIFRALSFLLIGSAVFSILLLNSDLKPESPHVRYKKLKARGPSPIPDQNYWIQRTWPHMAYDRDYYRNQMTTRLMKRQETGPAWEFIGPTNIGGRINDIEFNPKNPDVVYAGTATGGVLKSTDAGLTWTPVFDDQPILPIGDLAIDPNHPDTIYAGTGESHGSHNNFSGGGIYRSVNGGETWTLLGLDNTYSTGRIVVDRQNPDRIFVAAQGTSFGTDENRGIYRTLDGGKTWEKVLYKNEKTGGIDVLIHQSNPDIVLACLWEKLRIPESSTRYGPNSGLYRSTDGGTTWQKLGTLEGLPNSVSTQVGRTGITSFPGDPKRMAYVNTDGTYLNGIYESVNSGESWKRLDIDDELWLGTSSFSWYFGQIRYHPLDEKRIYVMDVPLLFTDNGGTDWTFDDYSFHVDQHSLAFQPGNPSLQLLGNDGGIYRSTDDGASWTKILDLPITQFYEIAIDPTDPYRVYGGTQDNGTLRTPYGAIDGWEEIYGGDGFYINIDPDNPDIIYAEFQFGGLSRSDDGGLNWTYLYNGIDFNEPTNWSTPVAMSPQRPQTLYYGTKRVYKTTDRGDNWTPISPDLAENPDNLRFGTLTIISPSPVDSNVIWAGTDNGRVWVTVNGGSSWELVSDELPLRWVMRIVPHPSQSGTAWVAFSGLKWKDAEPHIWKTTDFGANWESVSGDLPDLPVNALAFHPAKGTEGLLFAGTDAGLFFTENGGNSWKPLDNDMPAVAIYDLKIDSNGDYLVAGTHGRSMYRMDLNELKKFVSVKGDEPVVESFLIGPAYPNPFNGSVKIPARSSEPVQAVVYSITGQEITRLSPVKAGDGKWEFTWDGSASDGPVASGVYLVKVQAKGVSRTVRVVYTR